MAEVKRHSYRIHDRATDRLREAVRTVPAESWYLALACNVIRDAIDYRPTNSEGLHSWDFTIAQLEALEREGWLHRPDHVRFLPTDAAKNTWPPAASTSA